MIKSKDKIIAKLMMSNQRFCEICETELHEHEDFLCDDCESETDLSVLDDEGK